MSAYSEYFLNSRMDIVQYDLLEISHPYFTQTYRIVRNNAAGVTVDLSADDRNYRFEFYPVAISTVDSRDDMDTGIRVDFGDLGEVIQREIDALIEVDGFRTKPAVRYWNYRSDDLTAPLFGPIDLEISSMDFSGQGTGFEAHAPLINMNKTGERYVLSRFPMLRGFVG